MWQESIPLPHELRCLTTQLLCYKDVFADESHCSALTVDLAVLGLRMMFLQMHSRISPLKPSSSSSRPPSRLSNCDADVAAAWVARTRRSVRRIRRLVRSRQTCGPMVTEAIGTDWTCISDEAASPRPHCPLPLMCWGTSSIATVPEETERGAPCCPGQCSKSLGARQLQFHFEIQNFDFHVKVQAYFPLGFGLWSE